MEVARGSLKFSIERARERDIDVEREREKVKIDGWMEGSVT